MQDHRHNDISIRLLQELALSNCMAMHAPFKTISLAIPIQIQLFGFPLVSIDLTAHINKQRKRHSLSQNPAESSKSSKDQKTADESAGESTSSQTCSSYEAMRQDNSNPMNKLRKTKTEHCSTREMTRSKTDTKFVPPEYPTISRSCFFSSVTPKCSNAQ